MKLYNDWELKDGRTITLLTPKDFEKLSHETLVTDIFGGQTTVAEVMSRNDHTETRGGYTAYGFLKGAHAQS